MKIHRLKPFVLATFALLSAACSSDPAAPGSTNHNGTPNNLVAGTVEATVRSGVVTIRNTTEHPIGYVLITQKALAVALFPGSYPPCSNHCPANIDQGETVSVPLSAALGYTPQDTEAVVLWWKYSRRLDGTRVPVGTMGHSPVELR